MKIFLLLIFFVAVKAEFQSAFEYPHRYLSDPKLIPHNYETDKPGYELVIKDGKLGIVAGPQIAYIDPEALTFTSTELITYDEPGSECQGTLAYTYFCGVAGKCTFGGSITLEDNMYCGLTTTPDKYPSIMKINSKQTQPILTFTNKDHDREALPLECKSIFKNTSSTFEKLIQMKYITDRNGVETLYGLFANQDQKKRTIYGVCSYSMSEMNQKIDDQQMPMVALNKRTSKWDTLNKTGLTDDHVPAIHKNFQTSKTDFAMLNFNFTFDKNITHYAAMSFSGLDNVQYGIHYFATANGNILKGITDGKYVNITNELISGIVGKILQMEIFEDNLIVLTNQLLYSLPLSTCDSYWSCSKCVELQDPQCLWDDKSCVLAQEWHRNITYTQRIRDGKKEFCVKEIQAQHNKNVMDMLAKQLNRSKEELTKIEEVQKNQDGSFSDIKSVLNTVKETVHSIEEKLNEVNKTMVDYERSGPMHGYSFTDLLLTGFFAAIFCMAFVLVTRVVVYAKIRFVDKNTNYKLMDSVIMGNAYDRFTSPTNGEI